MMVRDPLCESDDCYEEVSGWVHVGGCEATSDPLPPPDLSDIRPGSFLDYLTQPCK